MDDSSAVDGTADAPAAAADAAQPAEPAAAAATDAAQPAVDAQPADAAVADAIFALGLSDGMEEAEVLSNDLSSSSEASSSSADAPADESQPQAADDALPTRGCEHYRRGCRLRAPCCGEVFACRFCHDAVKFDGERDEKKRHRLPRHLVRAVVCTACGLEQPPGRACVVCANVFGEYFCPICVLYDDDLSKKQFHCDKCGICRVGGAENFFHCDTCAACYSTDLRDNHRCIPNAMKSACPICQNYLFDSREAPQVLKCGHTLHRSCLEEYSKHGGYTCPQCNISLWDMRHHWEILDLEVARTPMPPEYVNQVVNVLCNDCHKESAANFHVVGLKCLECGSYNTRRL